MKDRREIEIGPSELSWGNRLEKVVPQDCPTADSLFGFVDGEIREEERNRVLAHLGHCKDCRSAIRELRLAHASRPIWKRLWKPVSIFAGLATAAAVTGILLVQSRSASSAGGIRSVATHSRSGGVGPTSRKRGDATVAVKPRIHTGQTLAPESGQNRTPVVSISPERPVTPKRSTSQGLVASNQSPKPMESVQTGGARAEKMYCLVGEKHVYALSSPDSHVRDREEIEESYADNVKRVEDHYRSLLAANAESAIAANELNVALNALREQRDEQLSSLYKPTDEIRVTHPELQVEGDGPYQVVEVQVHREPNSKVFDKYVVRPPWPGYGAKEHPYGWKYGVPYNRDGLRDAYSAWHRDRVETTGHAFYGIVGREGPVHVNIRYGTETRRFIVPGDSAVPADTRALPGSRYGLGRRDH